MMRMPLTSQARDLVFVPHLRGTVLLVAYFIIFGVPLFAGAAGLSGQSNGASCIDPTDCASGYCSPNNLCAPNPAAVGLTNQPNGSSCIDPTDCASGYCNANNICAQKPQNSPAARGSSGFTALAPIPGLTDQSATSIVDPATLSSFFNNLYKYLIGLAATLAVIMIIWGGLQISSSQGSAAKVSEGRERITQAIFGLLLVLSPVLVFSLINPSILNLSLKLPPIDLSAPPAGPSSSSSGTQTDASSGCTVSGVPNLLQIALCPSSAAAQKWGQQCSGQLTLKNIAKNAAGEITSVQAMCTTSEKFLFIDVHTSSFSSAIARIVPLAQSSSDPNNGSRAMQFARLCQSAGLQTCISDDPSLSLSVPCSPTPATSIPVSAPGKCYTETLSCKDASVLNTYCSSSPSWSIFK